MERRDFWPTCHRAFDGHTDRRGQQKQKYITNIVKLSQVHVQLNTSSSSLTFALGTKYEILPIYSYTHNYNHGTNNIEE